MMLTNDCDYFDLLLRLQKNSSSSSSNRMSYSSKLYDKINAANLKPLRFNNDLYPKTQEVSHSYYYYYYYITTSVTFTFYQNGSG